MRILLVERLPSRAREIAHVLGRFRAEILHAVGAATVDARMALVSRIDLAVLSQASLPDEEFDIGDRLRVRHGDVPIVFVGEGARLEHAVRAIQSGARGYVVRREGYLAELVEVVADIVLPREVAEATTRSQFEAEERRRLAAVLARHRWNVSATARALGISRGKLRSRLAALDMER